MRPGEEREVIEAHHPPDRQRHGRIQSIGGNRWHGCLPVDGNVLGEIGDAAVWQHCRRDRNRRHLA
jgi:hypothetical protein